MTTHPPVGTALIAFLEDFPNARVTLTFEEVEAILGTPLPNSARQYSSWWKGEHWMVRRLHDLGWKLTGSMAAQTLTFTRATHADGDASHTS